MNQYEILTFDHNSLFLFYYIFVVVVSSLYSPYRMTHVWTISAPLLILETSASGNEILIRMKWIRFKCWKDVWRVFSFRRRRAMSSSLIRQINSTRCQDHTSVSVSLTPVRAEPFKINRCKLRLLRFLRFEKAMRWDTVCTHTPVRISSFNYSILCLWHVIEPM